MPDLTEIIDLPDPGVQPLVHPNDLPQARPLFRRAQILAVLANPAVGLWFAAIVWFAGHNYVVPLIAGSAVSGFGALAHRFYLQQAWSFIPRKRQDRDRPTSPTWELTSALVPALLLAVALVLVITRLDQPDVTAGVREFTFGTGAGTALVIVLDLAVRLLRSQVRGALLGLPGLCAVLVAMVVAYSTLFTDAAAQATSGLAVSGALTLLVIGVASTTWTHLARRHAAA